MSLNSNGISCSHSWTRKDVHYHIWGFPGEEKVQKLKVAEIKRKWHNKQQAYPGRCKNMATWIINIFKEKYGITVTQSLAACHNLVFYEFIT